MMTFIRPRWRKPAGTVLAGAGFAAAWIIRGGPHWWLFATLVAVAALARAFGFYVWAGQDDDLGALAGSRADERQAELSKRSWALTGRVGMIAAFLGLTVAVALKAGWWWPFRVMLAVTAIAYGLGLSTLGIAQEEPADNTGTGQPARTPASS